MRINVSWECCTHRFIATRAGTHRDLLTSRQEWKLHIVKTNNTAMAAEAAHVARLQTVRH